MTHRTRKRLFREPLARPTNLEQLEARFLLANVVDFNLEDVNPNSPTSGSFVSPFDYSGKTTAWYFGHAT